MLSRKVIAVEVLRDIRNGMSRSELMEKHRISFPGLQGIVSVLVESVLPAETSTGILTLRVKKR